MTTYETETNGKDRLRVYVTGACEGLPELHVLAYDGRPADRAGGQGRKHG